MIRNFEYILTNRNHSVRVTNLLWRRAWERREGTGAGFATEYCCKK